MNFKYSGSLLTLASILLILDLTMGQNLTKHPQGVEFRKETLKRLGGRGDNWCITWTKDGSQIISMDDGDWLIEKTRFHNRLYRLEGTSKDFKPTPITQYPEFVRAGHGWFGYGIYAIGDELYSAVSKTPKLDWSGPFRGIKLLKSDDNGQSWFRVSRKGDFRLIEPQDSMAREEVDSKEMFFLEEFGKEHDGQLAYPFASIAFVQNGKANSAAKDPYIYMYSPEGAQSNELLLARVRSGKLEQRKDWEFFAGWLDGKPSWTSDLKKRAPVHVFPAKNQFGEYFGWYSWLPSVVWNAGLQCYIMVNGGSYGGHHMTNSAEDYYDGWMHTKTGSLGFWWSEKPYGPWKEFYYTDYWTVDAETNLTYQPKLSPKWISGDGEKMVLIWSDAMRNEKGKSHSINYRWNQMDIEIKLD
ncbi:MAG: DUF4185 domain-containing protein [Saprospiraceae bacterium]|nr:DUF4185 domain-containing protein [Saprospiraceae bacterium]